MKAGVQSRRVHSLLLEPLVKVPLLIFERSDTHFRESLLGVTRRRCFDVGNSVKIDIHTPGSRWQRSTDICQHRRILSATVTKCMVTPSQIRENVTLGLQILIVDLQNYSRYMCLLLVTQKHHRTCLHWF